MSEIQINNSRILGLNTDSSDIQKKPGETTFVLNGVVSNFDGQSYVIQNEQANKLCTRLPENHDVIGVFHITQVDKVLLFITDSDKSHEIGYVQDCEYFRLIWGECLNLHIDRPIHQIVVKNTNCGITVYWTDGTMRHFSFEDLPWREEIDPNNPSKRVKIQGELDCNKLLVQPLFSVPEPTIVSVEEGGNLTTGTYQFVAQYANEKGESYTSMYNVTNPISINQLDRATQDFDLPTSKAIRVKVEGLDVSGVFDHFNLVVIETVNLISTPKLVGTYPITSSSYDILYTGDSTAINLSMMEVFQRFQYYDRAGGVTQSDDRIIWYDLSETQDINYQPIASKVKLYWETYKIPYNESEGYFNPMNTLLYKGYMRDEVYPFEIVFLLKGGKQTHAYTIPGRNPRPDDFLTISNEDAGSVKKDKCDGETPDSKGKWEVYNTATVIGTHPSYNPDDSCYKGPYQYGEFGYWRSERKYPNNPDIWGNLANTPIRHHKFPDEIVSPRFSTDGNNSFIYPVGVKVDPNSLYEAIQTSNLTQEQKDDIVGFKIIRGDRTAGNMSVKAKGHFTNVGKYEYQEQEYYFPNYPYNSLNEDPLFATTPPKPGTGYSFNKSLKPFSGEQGKDQFTFHSPDIHFGRVENVDSGYLKLESVDYGRGIGHFTRIKNNAEYKFMTKNATQAAAALSAAVAFDLKSGKAKFNGSDFAQMYTNMNELFTKLVEYKNFGYNILSQVDFNKTVPVPNTGDKIRPINYGTYLVDGFNTIEDGKILNNKSRESSLYLNTEGSFKYAHEYSYFDNNIPTDDSRFIGSFSRGGDADGEELTEYDYFQLFRRKLVYSGIAVSMGVYAAAEDLSQGDSNLMQILMMLLAHILGDFTDRDDFQGLKSLEDIGDQCLNGPSTTEAPKKFFIFHDANGSVQPLHLVTNLDISVWNYHGESWGEDMTHTGYGIPPEWLEDLGILQHRFVTYNTWSIVKSNETLIIRLFPRELELDLAQTQDINKIAKETLNEEYTQKVTGEYLNFYKGYQAIKKYGATEIQVCGNDILEAVHKAFQYAIRYYDSVSFETRREGTLLRDRTFNANAYYGSIKSYLPAQWGDIYSYVTVDTGYYQKLDRRYNTFPTIFGGDTFINQFSLKRKLSVYDMKTVGTPDQSDISLDEMGTLGHPMFWISTKPLSGNFVFDESSLQTSLSSIGATIKSRVAGNLATAIGSVLITAGFAIMYGTSWTGYGAVVGVVVAAVGALVNIAGKVLVNKSAPIEKASISLFKQLITQIINNLGFKNINLDLQRDIGILTHGVIYQYVYGIPTYFVESQVNVDYRQATNDNEGNFYPRVGRGIPDEWLQEDRVPIIYDNNYTYNKTFSKQNRENFYTNLEETFDPTKLCKTEHPNRAFWSEKANLDETLDNWLIYKPVSYHDFPKSFGKLVSLDGILNKQVIARFQNKTQIYNALTTVNTSSFQFYLGNDQLFKSAPPIDLSETDTGSLGSQHKFMLKTPHGVITTDSKRGQVLLTAGTKVTILSDIGNSKWFDRNLKFFNSNPDNDNHFKGLGITGVYDEFYDRVIITKLDRTDQGVDKSWTMSFSFKTNSWVSWHSYIPNLYVGGSDIFYSIKGGGMWTHNTTYTEYTTYYGEKYPYIVEYPFVYGPGTQVIQSITDYTTALKYEDFDTYYEPDEILYFNKALIYNNQQTTGYLNLVPKPEGNLRSYMQYPKYNQESKDILLSKKGGMYSFNMITDITKVKGQKIILPSDDPTKTNIKLNKDNLVFGKRSFNQALLRSQSSKVRLILDNRHDVKLLSKVMFQQNQTSLV